MRMHLNSGLHFRANSKGLRCGFVIAVAVSAILTSGCTHIHNESNFQTAKVTVEQFQTIRNSSNSVFKTMLANAALVRGASQARLNEELALRTEAFLLQLDSVTWERMLDDLEKNKKNGDALNANLTAQLAKLLKARGVADEAVKTANDAKQKAEQLATQATTQELKWRAKQILLLDVLKLVAETGKVDSSTLDSIKDKALTDKIPETNQTVGDALSDEIKSLKSPNLLKPGDFAAALRSLTYDLFDPKAAPGANIAILGLSADLSEAAYKRASVEADYLRTRQSIMERALRNRNVTELGINQINSRKGTDFTDEKESILVTINRVRSKVPAAALSAEEKAKFIDQRDRTLRGLLEIVGNYVIAMTLDDPTLDPFEATLSEAKHNYSIQMAEVNAAEREAVTARSLQALQTYHSGGVTPEQIANLIRAAQTAGLGWIGAGVN